MTPLHYAMRAENGDAAMVLLEAGADPNIETYEHKSIPLSMIGYLPDRLDILEDEGWLVPVYELMKQYA